MSKNNNTSTSQSGGIGFVILHLTILFIGLKLTGYIEWSWLWVLSPLWISGCLFVLALFVIFLVAVVNTILED